MEPVAVEFDSERRSLREAVLLEFGGVDQDSETDNTETRLQRKKWLHEQYNAITEGFRNEQIKKQSERRRQQTEDSEKPNLDDGDSKLIGWPLKSLQLYPY